MESFKKEARKLRFKRAFLLVGVITLLLLLGGNALAYTVTGVELHHWRGGPGSPHEYKAGSTIKGFYGLFHLVIGVYQRPDEPPVTAGCSYIELWEGDQLLIHTDNPPTSSVQCINPPPGSNRVWTWTGGALCSSKNKTNNLYCKSGLLDNSTIYTSCSSSSLFPTISTTDFNYIRFFYLHTCAFAIFSPTCTAL
jgi:hypothetical protein